MEYDRCGVPNNEVNYDHSQGTLYRRLRDEAGYHVAGTGKFDLTAQYPFGKNGHTSINEWGFSDAIFTPAKNETVQRVKKLRESDDPYTRYLEDHGLLETHIQDYAERVGERGSLVDGKLVATQPTPLPRRAYYDEFLRRSAERLITQTPTNQPWFIQVNFQNPHDPWDVTEAMHAKFRAPNVRFPSPEGGSGDMDPAIHQEVRRNYTAMVEHLDSCVGSLLGTLGELGELDETVIMYISDHGEMLGDYGQWQKDSPLQASLGVPMIISGPDIESRKPESHPTTILDLHSTILELAGLDIGQVDSRSMQPYLAGHTDNLPRNVVYSGLSAWRVVFDGRFKLIRGYDPDIRRGTRYEPRGIEPNEVTRLLNNREPILYDLNGKGEPHNVVTEYPEKADQLTQLLFSIRGTPTSWRS